MIIQKEISHRQKQHLIQKEKNFELKKQKKKNQFLNNIYIILNLSHKNKKV